MAGEVDGKVCHPVIGIVRYGGQRSERVGYDPAIDVRHHAVALCRRKQRFTRHARPFRVGHAQQDFEAGPLVLAVQVQDRLCVQQEPVAVEGLLDLGDQLHVVVAANDALVLFVVDLDSVATVVLGGLAGHARGGQRAAVVPVRAAEFRDADAHRDLQRPVALKVTQLLAVIPDLLRKPESRVSVGMRQQHAKVITGQARQHAALRQVFLEQARETHDDGVAGLAAERVVDELQIVEVKVDQLVRVVGGRECLVRLVQLVFEAGPIHESGHRIERALDNVFDLAHDVGHEAPFARREFAKIDATELRQDAFHIALAVQQGTQQGLVAVRRRIIGSLDGRDLEHHWLTLAFQFRQQLLHQVTIQNLAIDRLPARMRRTDADPLRGNQQYAVIDAEKAAALADQLGKTRVACLDAVNPLVNLVDEVELPAHVVDFLPCGQELLAREQALTNHFDGRFENGLQEARVKRRRLARVFREQCNQHADPVACLAEDRQGDHRASRGQRAAQKLVTAAELLDDFLGQVRDEAVDLVVLTAIGTPDARAGHVIEAEALRTRHQRAQESACLADIVLQFKVMDFCCHDGSAGRCFYVRPSRCQRNRRGAVTQVSGNGLNPFRISQLRDLSTKWTLVPATGRRATRRRNLH